MKSPTQTHLDAHMHVHITQLSCHKHYKCYTYYADEFIHAMPGIVCVSPYYFIHFIHRTSMTASQSCLSFVGTRGHLGECRKLVSILHGTCMHRCGMDSDLQRVCKACLCWVYHVHYRLCILLWDSVGISVRFWRQSL